MELLCVMAALAALFLGSAALTLKARIPAGLAPLVTLSCIVAVLTLAGMAGVLYPAAWAVYALCAAGGVWALLPPKEDKNRYYAQLATPGSVTFWALALAFAVYFFVRQPMATVSDEFSLWATAVKVTKVDNSLYSTATLGTPWAVTQNPGLPLLSYFFQFFGQYADWKIYLAYDVLFFAVYAAVLSVLPWKQWRVAVPMAAVLWVTPFFFTVYNHTIYLTTVYLSSYGDIPAGLVFGSAVAVWLALRQQDGPRWAVLPVLALAANLKANDFVLSLAAAGLIAVDAWLFCDGKFKQGLARRTGFAVACFAAPMAVYYLWNVRYVGWLVSRNASEGGVGETTASMGAVVINGIKILLGRPVTGFFAEREPQFRQAMADMGHQFWTSDGKLGMIGQGRNIVVLIAVVFVVALATAGSRRLRLRIGSMGVLSAVCFLGYNLELALSYGFIFKPFQAERLEDYNRYIESYYIGWFLMALACLMIALQPQLETVSKVNGPTAAFTTSRYAPKCPLAAQGIVLLLAVAMLVRQNQIVLPQLSVLGFADSEFADRKQARAEAEYVCENLQPDDRVFYVSQGDNGEGWFSAVFDFYPVLVDYSGIMSEMNGGGGTFGLPELKPDEGVKATYYHAFTADELDAIVRGNGCTVLYIQKLDDIFVQSYSDLFTDKLAAAQAGETLLYRVTDAGYAPVEMQGGAA